VTGADPSPSNGPSETGFTIREMRWSDFDGLRETYFLLYEERASGYPIGIGLFRERPTYADEARWFSGIFQRVQSGESVASIAEVDGQAVGSCIVTRVGPTEGSEAAHMGDLGILIHREYRGRGIGSALLKDSLRQCRGKFGIVRLAVFSFNEGARRLYERFGFVPYGHLPKALRRGTEYFDEDLMFLDLTGPEANR
jgi:RimJ/RimL family protein N-acetyltransferase